MTRALEMYNWLSEKVKVKKTPSGLTTSIEKYIGTLGEKYKDAIVSRANNIVTKVLSFEKDHSDASNQKKMKDKHNQIVNLYLRVLEDLLIQEEKKTKSPNYFEILTNENFHKALIACSIETVNFVMNSTNISFTKLLEICEVQAFEFWRIIGSFVKFDPQMPYPMKKNLHDVELKILMCLAWKRDSVVHQLLKNLINESNTSNQMRKFCANIFS